MIFTLDLQERQGDGSYDKYNHASEPEKNKFDEFLIYTKTFSFYDEYFADNPGTYEDMEQRAWEGEVTMINRESWSTNGRVMAFRTLNKDESGVGRYGLQTDGSYNIYMLTNSSYNKDVVRVASNNVYSMPVFKEDRDENPYLENYQGNEYRSVIFDVAHYRPYRLLFLQS